MRCVRGLLSVIGILLLALVGAGPGSAASTPAATIGRTTFTQVAVGMAHTCGLTTAGGVLCWGSGTWGELGDGTTTGSRPVPAPVVGLSSGVHALSSISAAQHNCALLDTGRLECWGWNDQGQLGDGTHTTRTTPVPVKGAPSGIVSVSAGGQFTCVLTTAGAVWCWGVAMGGSMGTPSNPTPHVVPGLSSGVAALSAGDAHACAVMTSGTLKCWGDNSNGQLGDGTTTDSVTPVDVVGLGSGVASVGGGAYDTCAVTTAGAAWCWGKLTDSTAPIPVPGMSSGVASVTGAQHHTCLLTTSGAAKCWGYGDAGVLGTGSWESASTPQQVVGLTAGVTSVVASSEHSCALTAAGVMKCWGGNWRGELGDGTTIARSVPVDVKTGPARVARLWGTDRYVTSAAIAAAGFPQRTGRYAVASGELFPDSLSGAAFAAQAPGPLLLTRPQELPNAVRAELDRLGSGSGTIFGGPVSVWPEVATQLRDYGPVRRLAGADRYATSAAISAASSSPGVDVAYVASGRVFPDALSAAPLAAMRRAPLLLTTPDVLPPVVATELARLRPKSVVVIGGPVSVSGPVLAQLHSITGVPVSRVVGADRYAVSAALARRFFAAGRELVVVASGETFADALSGGALAGRYAAPVLLVKRDEIPASVTTELGRLRPRQIVVLGGPATVGPEVEAALAAFIRT